LNLTPKALANFSPGFELSENPGLTIKRAIQNLKGFGSWRTLSGLSRDKLTAPGLSLRANLGLKLANAFGVKFKLRHHRIDQTQALIYLCLGARIL
jgi:hypothetical protein